MRESIENSTVGLSLGQPISVGFYGCTTSGAHDWLTSALWVKPNKEIVLRKMPTLGLIFAKINWFRQNYLSSCPLHSFTFDAFSLSAILNLKNHLTMIIPKTMIDPDPGQVP